MASILAYPLTFDRIPPLPMARWYTAGDEWSDVLHASQSQATNVPAGYSPELLEPELELELELGPPVDPFFAWFAWPLSPQTITGGPSAGEKWRSRPQP